MDQLLPTIYAAAVLLPLFSFVLILCCAPWLGRFSGWLATSAILAAGILSFVGLGLWLNHHFPPPPHHGEHAAAHGGHEEHPTPHEDQGKTEKGHHEESKADEGKTDAGKSSNWMDGLPVTLVALVQEPTEKAKTGEGAPTGSETAAAEPASESPAAHTDGHAAPPIYAGEYYTLAQFGPLRVTISYYIDALTVVMFCMVTFIATCIHFYSVGYMHDELSPVTDKEVALASGEVLHRPGRFPRFFQYLSLFCFSMLGLVLAGNIAMVFVFWELVGICSYFLIGFYIERRSASTAANKAFIVNRIGDFGMIIGLMVIWSTLGTFAFGDVDTDSDGQKEPGIFSQIRRGSDGTLTVPDGMVQADAYEEVARNVEDDARDEAGLANAKSQPASDTAAWRAKGYGYWLLVLAGIGIFCGCVGKSAQFPLHVWLPDAMEGPTPVSALVHSAAMVAAGVYLVGRFYPVFTPEVLLVIAVIGTITMLLGASIAFAANDIKRVLAYSTVSQLGLMMLALGVGGWLAGMMHLITHAFFKSLLFMCSGSVIHAVHTNDLRKMGGLFHKMPATAITMLIGCLAIAGVAVPFVVGFSGYYSKDAILEQALSFWATNQTPQAGLFFVMAVFGAALTTCYMFRMWFLTFVGQPRDPHAYEHAHESPPVMVLPLVVLAGMAVALAWNYQFIGYFGIAAAFFVARAVSQGWFKGFTSSPGQGHDDHDRDHADHGRHGHVVRGHAAQGRTEPGPAQAAPAEPPLTWGWVAMMLLGTVLVGWFIQRGIGESPRDALSLVGLLEQARPLGTAADATGAWTRWKWPNEHFAHEPAQFATIVVPATLLATASWAGGILLAAAFFWRGALNPDDVRRQFAALYNLLVNKWWFDELYDALFVQPTMVLSRMIAGFDKRWIDGFLDGTARSTVWFADRWDLVADRTLVDGFVNLFAGWTWSLGLSLRAIQTGRIRQYVMFIVIGAIAIFALVSIFWNPTLAR